MYVELSELKPSELPAGTNVITEGRYAGKVGDTVALAGSSVIFVVHPKAHTEVYFQLLTGKSYLRLHGEIVYREVTNTFYVSVKRIDSAEDFVERIMAALNDPQATRDRLYGIGRAGRSWAEDYPDQRLLELADTAMAKALKMEDIELGPEDWEGYFRLAEKAAGLLVDSALPEYYVREGVRAYIIANGRRRPESYYEAARFAEKLLQDLPLAEILLEKGFLLERGIKETDRSRDHYALAAKAHEIFGEGRRHQSLLARAIDDERGRIAENDYQALYLLARKIRDIHPEYADYRVVVTRAIIAEKADMDMEDPGAWNRLGSRILFCLDDEYQAAFYFKEAFRLAPSQEEAAARLRELGLVYYRGNWWRRPEFGRMELFEKAKRLEELAEAGSVATGMSTEQVIRAKGRPARVQKAGGGWGRTTQWVYEDSGGTLYVSFIADTVIAHGGL